MRTRSKDYKTLKQKPSCTRSCFCKFDLSRLANDGKLNELRQKNLFQDSNVQLVSTDGSRHPVNRVILAFMGSTFTKKHGPLESVNEVKLSYDSSVVECLLDFLHIGNCALNNENVEQLMIFASEYKLNGLLKLGYQYILSCTNPSNVVDFYKFSQNLKCYSFTHLMEKFILLNFNQVCKNSNILAKCQSKEIQEFLKSDKLNVSEEELFNVILNWFLEFSDDDDIKIYLKHIRFILVNISFFENGILNSPLRNHPLILDAKREVQKYDRRRKATRIYSKVKTVKRRLPNELIFVIGGWNGATNSPTDVIEVFDIRSDKWTQLFEIRAPQPRSYHGLVEIQNQIYLFGGYTGSGQNGYHSTLHIFDPVTKEWMEKSPMNFPRCYSSMAVLNDRIYAIGGHNGQSRMSSMEFYDAESNQWLHLRNMEKLRSDASAVGYKNKIIIVGGFTGTDILRSTEIYDINSDQWSYGPRLNTRRSGVKTIVHNDVLYAIGGYNGSERLSSVETLDLTKLEEGAQWGFIAPMNTTRSNFSLAQIYDRIYVIGGYDGSGVINKVEYYDPEINNWIESSPMNIKRSALRAVVVKGLCNVTDFIKQTEITY